MVRTKPPSIADASKGSPQKKEAAAKAWKPKDLWIGCRVKYKDYVFPVKNDEKHQIIGANSYKRDIHGVVAVASPVSPYYWKVEFGDGVGLIECEDKFLSKELKQKKLIFLKPPTQSSVPTGAPTVEPRSH